MVQQGRGGIPACVGGLPMLLWSSSTNVNAACSTSHLHWTALPRPGTPTFPLHNLLPARETSSIVLTRREIGENSIGFCFCLLHSQDETFAAIRSRSFLRQSWLNWQHHTRLATALMQPSFLSLQHSASSCI